jgi:hypothetical protein
MLALALLLSALPNAQSGPTEPTEAVLAILPELLFPGKENPSLVADLRAATASAAARRSGLRPMSSEEAFVAGVNLEAVARCGGDAGCLASALAPTHARLLLIVVANLRTAPPLIALRLFDLERRRLIESAAATLEKGRGLADVVMARTAKLLDDAGLRRAARLSVEVSPSDATVAVLGGPSAEHGAPNVFSLGAGRWRVRAERSGYRPREIEVEAKSGANVRVELALEPESASILASPWFWTAVIAAAIGGAALVYVGTHHGSCVCLGPADKNCPPC